MSIFVCTYCGEPVPDGCPHPNVFECCGEIGHVEEVYTDDDLAENDQQAHANDIDPETGCTQEEMR